MVKERSPGESRRCLPGRFASVFLSSVLRVISKSKLLEKAVRFPDTRTALQVWLETVQQAAWLSLNDLRATYPATDMLGKLAIFNSKGGHYRLIVRIEFEGQRIYIKKFLTHAEYDKGAWEKWL